ncbi:MAG: RNA polymerase factor sigma-54 [Bacteroidia bacterium]|nr:RNA polymerase factor sigma-54 [Bacteroidia bacterium]
MGSSGLRTELSQRQLLRQNLHQIQLARLLEVPTEELDKHIQEEIEKNAALELEEASVSLPEGPLLRSSGWGGESPDGEESSPEFSTGSGEPREDFYGPFNFSGVRTLYDYLSEQLATLEFSPRERLIAEYIIGNLDEKGYLTEAIPKIARHLSMEPALEGHLVSPEEVEHVLSQIQRLEPAGIAARSAQECLLLQAQALPEEDGLKKYFLRLFQEDFPLLSQGRFDKIRKKYNLKDEEWSQFLHRLRSFSLNPAAGFSEETAPQVTPDFVLRIQEEGVLRVELVRSRPVRLRINPEYRRLLEQYTRKRGVEGEMAEVIQHVKERVERAERFIELLKQREDTLLRTAQEIVRHQRTFFLSGCNERFLRPLILQDIAEAVKLDISTISRVVNSKYIETPCGIYSLKYFFSEGVRTREGKRISNKAIKSILKELIQQENPEDPYSDERLMKLLQQKGIEIKRRTVAKYREQLGIPSARERRRLPPT